VGCALGRVSHGILRVCREDFWFRKLVICSYL
jgi:hypothetical protein